MTTEAEILDASQAADLAALQAMAGAESVAQGGDPAPAGPSPVDRVEMSFRPAFAMLAAMGPRNAAFYTPERARAAAEIFVPLAESEGWSLEALEGKWGLRIAFLMTVTPPHALEWAIAKITAFGKPAEQGKKEGEGGEREDR